MPTTIADLQRWGRSALGGDPSASGLEVDLLLGFVLKLQRSVLYRDADMKVPEEAHAAFRALIERRLEHEPVAYLIGEKEFFGRSFVVNRDVLIPRPETELLVARAVELCADKSSLLVDIGTGSGAIMLSVLCEIRERQGQSALNHLQALATDISLRALEVAKLNARRLELECCVSLVGCDLFGGVKLESRGHDLLFMCNPPYIADSIELPPDVESYEPRTALRAGPEGMDVIVRLLHAVKPFLANGARLLMEIGYPQRVQVECALHRADLRRYRFHYDLSGRERVAEVWG